MENVLVIIDNLRVLFSDLEAYFAGQLAAELNFYGVVRVSPYFSIVFGYCVGEFTINRNY